MADQPNEFLQSSSVPQEPAMLTLSDDEFDIHVCGKCKESFTDLTLYIEHKKSKLCLRSRERVRLSSTSEELDQSAEITVQNETFEDSASENVTHKTVILPLHTQNPGDSCSNKVVVELLDPVDICPVITEDTDENVLVEHDTDVQQEPSTATLPKKRHKRKNSTPKTTRKSKRAASSSPDDSPSGVSDGNGTVTVHIPESQLVHLGASGELSPGEATMAKVRKQEATSVFVPIYLTNSKRTFKCSKCPAEFRTKEERGDHGSLHKKHFKCGDCSKRYYTPEALETHRTTETHVHACDQCGKVFHSQVYLKRHKAIHVEERNFACDICLKTYTSLANCRAHKRSVHAVVKKHVCDECGKAFARKDKLKRHQLIHIPYPNRPVFPCPFRSHTGCTSTFYREDKLKRHLFTHSKEKPYKCEECAKGFARRDNLNDHMKTHTKEFSYVCRICQRGFLGPAKLKKHMKAVHPDDLSDLDAIPQKITMAPTMATFKEVLVTHDEVPATQEKAVENVGLDLVNEAISSTNYEQNHGEEVSSEEEQGVNEGGHVGNLPPAPPLIHQPSMPSNPPPRPIPTGSVFIPRVNLQHGTYNRDMVTIPNELLSMVHGLNT